MDAARKQQAARISELSLALRSSEESAKAGTALVGTLQQQAEQLQSELASVRAQLQRQERDTVAAAAARKEAENEAVRSRMAAQCLLEDREQETVELRAELADTCAFGRQEQELQQQQQQQQQQQHSGGSVELRQRHCDGAAER